MRHLNATPKLAAIILTAIITISIAHQLSTAPRLGVKEGDWETYLVTSTTTIRHVDDPEHNGTESGSKWVEFKILEVNWTNMKAKESVRDDAGNLVISRDFWVDPTRLIKSSYEPGGLLEHDFNILIVPAGLSPGDSLPDSIYFPDKNGVTVEYPRWQRFNDTLNIELTKGDLPHSNEVRTANHFRWSVDLEYPSSYLRESREGFYNASTGVMLMWSYNYMKAYRYVGFPETSYYHYEVSYRLFDSSILGLSK
jgi:hypothetical protein